MTYWFIEKLTGQRWIHLVMGLNFYKQISLRLLIWSTYQACPLFLRDSNYNSK